MVGFNFCGCRIGTVAIFATLLVAIQVNGQKGCVFDFEHGNAVTDFDLECKGLPNSWKLKEADTDGPRKAYYALDADQDGCLKTRYAVPLNSTTGVVVRFNRATSDDVTGLFKMRLIPTSGTCPDEECVWVPKTSDQSKIEDGWEVLEYKFPLKKTQEYNIQIEVGKRKDKFLLNSISIPDVKDGSICHGVDTDMGREDVAVNAKFVSSEGNDTTPGGGGGTTEGSTAAGLAELSKNLLLTSALVLMLNHLLI